MSSGMSKTQVDHLGNRLRAGQISEEDARLLESYRLSFAPAYEKVISLIRAQLGIEPAGRPAKTTLSIVDKLNRGSFRLSQIQDIAGCRIVQGGSFEQDELVQELAELFPGSLIDDRRVRPSHGYRAVHLIVPTEFGVVEIQVRTELQHLWAELSEKYSDIQDSTIKYGGGSPGLRAYLDELSHLITSAEDVERMLEESSEIENPSPDEMKALLELEKIDSELHVSLRELLTQLPSPIPREEE